MGFFKKKIKVLTHDGRFHADDVFAVATLSILHKGNIKIIRTRDSEIIKSADIVVDVGGEYSPEKNIFDHHQSGGAGYRPNGAPYAAFGLVWKHFGMKLVSSEKVHQKIDQKMIQAIDASDAGTENFYSEKYDLVAYVPDTLVTAFNTVWDEDDSKQFKRFKFLVFLAEKLIQREIFRAEKYFEGEKFVEDFYQKSDDKRLIIMDRYYPWEDVLISKEEPVYTVYQDINDKKWRISAVPILKNSRELRKRLPESWGGKRDKELQEISGVNGAMFCHLAGFLAGAETKESAIKMAKIALES